MYKYYEILMYERNSGLFSRKGSNGGFAGENINWISFLVPATETVKSPIMTFFLNVFYIAVN